MVVNSGVAFGIPIGGWWWQGVLLLGVVVLWWRNNFKFNLGLTLVFLGGVMNFQERVWTGFVRDYIRLGASNLWFNGADVLITVGCIVYIWQSRRFFTKIDI